MGNGDINSRAYNIGGGDDDSGEAPAAFVESEIAVGLNMHHALSSYHSNKINNFMSPSSYYHNNQLHKHQASTEIGAGVVFGSDSGGSMGVTGKVLFTATQWQELERQTMIYKYIMASIPVPPQLLIPLSIQSTRGVDMRFSSGSDPEPWRCRRTDGKKWRCSRDVAPDQKYCERHAHKSRPRSRKPVESQPHNTITTTSALNITPTVNPNSLTTSSHQYSSWSIPASSSTQQFQQSVNSPKVGSKRNHIFPQERESHNSYGNLLDATSTAGARRQNFIDAWSRSGGGDNCSLTLSMQCSGGIDDDDRNFEIDVGMLDVEREGSGDVLKSHNQWLNQSSWMGSLPGGPLGEALGLGIVSSVNGPLNATSSHGHSGSTTTSTLCENGGNHGHEFSFIR